MVEILEFCSKCSSCPVVKIDGERVEIGEPGNLCVLTRNQWEDLKKKIIKVG